MEADYRNIMINKSPQELVDNLVELNKYIGIQSVEIKRLNNLVKSKEGLIMELEKQIRDLEDAGANSNAANIGRYYNKKKRKLRLNELTSNNSDKVFSEFSFPDAAFII